MSKTRLKRLYLIPILSKALDVLELLEQDNAPLSLEEVFQRTEISKTSVYRILKTLVHRGYVAQTQEGLYRLVSRPRRLRFGYAMQDGDLPFSQAVAQSLTAAAAASGVELIILDNRSDGATAVRNAEEFVARHVDLVLEFQADDSAAPLVARVLKKAEIPLIAIDVPHPNSTYFGVDNYEVGYEAGAMLALHALRHWKGHADWIVGVDFAEAGTLVQSRLTGAFEALRERLPSITADRYLRVDGRGVREPSRQIAEQLLRQHPAGERLLLVVATDSSALGILDAARQMGREHDLFLVGQDCIPEVVEEMRKSFSALVGSISHEVTTYGPRLIQLGIALLRGYTVPPYNYVRHRVVTPETLRAESVGGAKSGDKSEAKPEAEPSSALAE